jgi:Excalibur calcium-binding domain
VSSANLPITNKLELSNGSILKKFTSVVLAGLLLAFTPIPAEAKVFKNCAELRKVYPQGVSSSSKSLNKGAGPILAPRVNRIVFNSNKRLDLDKDGIACEVLRPKVVKPASPAPAPAPSPTPTPTPSPTTTPSAAPAGPFDGLKAMAPWTEEISGTSLSDAAQFEFRKWMLEQEGKPVRHTVTVDGSPNAVTLELIRSGDALASRLFSQFFPEGSHTLISANPKWIGTKGVELGILSSPQEARWCETPSWAFQYCLNRKNFTGYVIYSEFGPSLQSPGGGALPMHEYFHNVQSQLIGKPGENDIRYPGDTARALLPAWWVEGTAEFAGFVMFAELQQAKYSSFRDAMMSANPGMKPNENAIKDYEIRLGDGNGTIIYPYNVGRMAAEYLVASRGFQSVIDLHLDYRKSSNFRTSFQKIYGIEVDDFYAKFDRIRTKIGLPPISMEVRGEKNFPKI